MLGGTSPGMRRGLVIEGGWGLGVGMSGCVQEEGQMMGGEVSVVGSAPSGIWSRGHCYLSRSECENGWTEAVDRDSG